MRQPAWRTTTSIAVARTRADLLHKTRAYFARQRVLEVQTPCLSRVAVSDLHIDSVVAHVASHRAFLRTSPEYAMKRLLASGYPDIYEIGRVFRDGEQGKRHQPEFTMIEWYRHEFGLQEIIDDTTALLGHLCGDLLTTGIEQYTYDDALEQTTGLRSDSPTQDVIDYVGADVATTFDYEHDALLEYLFDTVIACDFRSNCLTVVSHYPASMAALAEISQHCKRALRFEVYVGALELANGFVELRDAKEQRARFERDLTARAQRNKPVEPLDERFLAALSTGLPNCAGVAVGFDRVVMLATGEKDIRHVVSFSEL